MKKGCLFILLIAAVIGIISALTWRADTPSVARSSSPAKELGSIGVCAPVLPAPESITEPSPVKAMDPEPTEPDWSERKAYWTQQHTAAFKSPKMGQDLRVAMVNGSAMAGKLKSLSPSALTLEIGGTSITVDGRSMTPQARVSFLAQYYAEDEAVKSLAAEKTAYSSRKEEWRQREAARIQSEADRKDASRLAANRAKFDVMFNPDGSFLPLVETRKRSLNDASSFEHVATRKCYQGNSMLLTMDYRAKNGFGAKILERVEAKVDLSSGAITITSQP